MSNNNSSGEVLEGADSILQIKELLGEMRRMLRGEMAQLHEWLELVENAQPRNVSRTFPFDVGDDLRTKPSQKGENDAN